MFAFGFSREGESFRTKKKRSSMILANASMFWLVQSAVSHVPRHVWLFVVLHATLGRGMSDGDEAGLQQLL